MTGLFERVLVANRGEIAVRIMRTLRALGIESVAVFTDPDRDALHVRRADRAVAIGGARAYLDVDRVIEAARAAGAQALHPGYGFLSENPALTRSCAENAIAFVGPPATAIELMGDKINAKRTAAAAGVPVVPGRDEAGLTDSELAAAAVEIGLPVLLKPSAGGGGKGMRVVTDPSGLASAIAAARREARGAFGDDTLLVERYVARTRHIEVQVFADTHGSVVALGERECSLQRRHQKIVEETPSVLLDDATRTAMFKSAVAAARACGYVGAGTVEFIVSGDRPEEYFFMEMNTRLQVEHPVTEMVLGVDLVEWQLRVAAGEPLPWPDQASAPGPRGHAVEARIYAEDPARDFLPSTGTVRLLHEPRRRPHLRIDSGLRAAQVVGTDYDPMLSKVVAWGGDRAEALSRLQAGLGETAVIGVTTNVGFLRRLLGHPDVRAGDLDTDLVERIAGQLQPDPAPPEVVAAAALLDELLDQAPAASTDPWEFGDGWRLSGRAPRASRWHVSGEEVEVSIADATLQVGALPPTPGAARFAPRGGRLEVSYAGSNASYSWVADGDDTWLGRQGDAWHLTRRRETIDHTGPAPAAGGLVTSPMPGTVLEVLATVGQAVADGEPLLSVEAMKMEHVVTAPFDGTVDDVFVKAGDSVGLDQPLAHVTAGEDGGS